MGLSAWMLQNQLWLDVPLWAILGVLSVLFLILLVNLLTYPHLQIEPQPEEKRRAPLLSILLPARNEEQCIESCVRSLLAQDYEPLEVLVLDDQSTDATAEIVQRLIDELPPEQHGRLRLVRGEELPTGWIGKNFACHQLAQHAQGELLYFTDADTIHAPQTVRAVVDCMERYQVQLLSAHPEYIFGSLGERLLVPLLNFTMLVLLPLALVPRRPEPTLSNGNGQLMCFRRETYEHIGGHVSVKDSLIEDVVLARLCKAAGHRMIFVDASTLVSCRMYRSFGAVVAGFSKSHFAPYGFKIGPALLSVTLLLLLFVVPPILALLALLEGVQSVLLLALTAYLLVVVMRMLITLRCNHVERIQMLLLCFLHPVSIVLEGLIVFNSIRWYYRKAGVTWKGRAYSGVGNMAEVASTRNVPQAPPAPAMDENMVVARVGQASMDESDKAKEV